MTLRQAHVADGTLAAVPAEQSGLEPAADYPDITKARSELEFAQMPESAYPPEIQADRKGDYGNDQKEHVGGGTTVADE